MPNVLSNNFNVTIDKSNIQPNTVIEIYKAGKTLAPVNTTPISGQYKVTIINTVNCTAKLEADYKTITVIDVTDNKGEINISINIEIYHNFLR